MENLKKLINKTKLFENAPAASRTGALITGADREYKILYAINLFLSGKKVFFVCQNDYEAKKVYFKLSKYVSEDDLYYYPKDQLYFTYADSLSTDISNMRIKTVNAAYKDKACIVVTSIWAVSEKRPFHGAESKRVYREGDKLDTGELSALLSGYGYQREERTEAPGQFSVRGGIIDIFTGTYENPVRIELFADEIDSIRTYDAQTQRSVEKTEQFELFAFSEIVLTNVQRKAASENIKREADDQLKKIKDKELKGKVAEKLSELTGFLDENMKEADRLSFVYTDCELKSIIDIFGKPCFVLDEPAYIEEGYHSVLHSVRREFALLLEQGLVFPSQLKIFYELSQTASMIQSREYAGLCQTEQKAKRFFFGRLFNAGAADALDYRRNVTAFIALAPTYFQNDYRIILTYTDDGQFDALNTFLSAYELDAAPIGKGKISLFKAYLDKGMDVASAKVLLLPYQSLLEEKVKTIKSDKKKRQKTNEFFSDIKPGDYVVHEVHGIGIYEGIERISLEGISKDYIKIKYAKEDALYIPADQMDLIQKYVGSGDSAPKINRLGTAEWANTKSKVRGAVKELAQEYIKMYAEREMLEGYAFGPDNEWQSEFEGKFEFDPTDDQIKCSEEIKSDMQENSPMDRLLLGDVGYGKTEVAIRAAFKAIMDGKQVAVLVPTTILALQHYNSFVKRFSGYPIKIEMLSRLKSASGAKNVLRNISSGASDILIGTHRILSGDVMFKDLGLLIVDEEQRFGVAHKDRLKLIKRNVDTLTLSATPIPRTLHMSLTGIKDISVIDTPPKNRVAVQTYVMPYDEIIVKEAIQNELARGGQVFYVHNRVQSIEQAAERIASLVPGSRVAYAHGQMPKGTLEKTVMSFLNNEYDILVSTSIIENGVDFVNANTIVIEDADRLGLSQLYQLRGRVGRGERQAYAYMMYKKDKVLGEDAAKRLQSIKEFTKFGSGFKIAMRDLQIRGAGNILGAKQHGHFQNVGYEMYCRMLEEAVGENIGEQVKRKIETEIDLLVDAFIPQDYISSEIERIEIYKKISAIGSIDDMTDVTDEIIDRYSNMPKSVENLINIAYCKSVAQKCGVTKIKQNNKEFVLLEYGVKEGFDAQKIQRIGRSYRIKIKKNAEVPTIVFKTAENEDIIKWCLEMLSKLL